MLPIYEYYICKRFQEEDMWDKAKHMGFDYIYQQTADFIAVIMVIKGYNYLGGMKFTINVDPTWPSLLCSQFV